MIWAFALWAVAVGMAVREWVEVSRTDPKDWMRRWWSER